jgi:hypothetical protein
MRFYKHNYGFHDCGITKMIKTPQGAFIHGTEEDTLEMDIRIVLNVRHPEYGKLYTALSKMLKNAQKKPDLVRMTSGL